MNCTFARRHMLLDQPDELAAEQRRLLDQHLAGCAACRAECSAWQRLAETMRTAPPPPPLPPEALQRILDEGRRALPRRARATRRFTVVALWRPALAAAASLLLLAGGFRLANRSHSRALWEDGIDQQLEQIGRTLANLSSDSLNVPVNVPDNQETPRKETPELKPKEQVI